jgi:8-oxo-dGTP pyrophosphatase MutT (NUDIX family)
VSLTPPAGKVTRDFTVAVFVVHDGRILLHFHPKLAKWLPPGGHIEPDELPDEAALREVVEEAGLEIRLVGGRGLAHDYPGQPTQLVVPAGIQLEYIAPGHEHIDLVYFAVPARTIDGTLPDADDAFEWIAPDDLGDRPVSDEVRDWCGRAVREVSG